MIGYRIAPLAQFDLDKIFDHVARDSVRGAERLMARLQKRFLLLAEHPLLGEQRDDLRSGLRAFTVGNYVIFYRLEESRVVIVRVLHAARDVDALF
jgi:toxin ParE1/3/4